MGCLHAEQPVFGKIGVRPAVVGQAPAIVIMFAMTLEQDTPQASPNQTIQVTEHRRVRRVFEIFNQPLVV